MPAFIKFDDCFDCRDCKSTFDNLYRPTKTKWECSKANDKLIQKVSYGERLTADIPEWCPRRK